MLSSRLTSALSSAGRRCAISSRRAARRCIRYRSQDLPQNPPPEGLNTSPSTPAQGHLSKPSRTTRWHRRRPRTRRTIWTRGRRGRHTHLSDPPVSRQRVSYELRGATTSDSRPGPEKFFVPPACHYDLEVTDI